MVHHKLETGKISQTVLQKLTRKLSNERSSKGEKTDPFVPVFIYAVLLPIPETVPIPETLPLWKGNSSP